MANTLTGLYQTIYAAFNVVSRELVGFIPAVSKDSQAEQVTLNQPIRSPVVPANPASDIEASNVSATGTDQDVEYIDVEITKQRKVTMHFTAEEEKGLEAGGVMNDITMQRYVQAFRTLGNEIEADLAALYVGASRAYGTIGTVPFNTADDLSELAHVGRILDDNGAPMMGRSLIMNTNTRALLQGKQPSVFRVNEAGDSMGRRMGAIGMLFNFDLGVSGQLREHDASQTIAGLMVNQAGGVAAGTTEIPVDGGGAA